MKLKAEEIELRLQGIKMAGVHTTEYQRRENCANGEAQRSGRLALQDTAHRQLISHAWDEEGSERIKGNNAQS